MRISNMTEANRSIWSSHLFWMVLCCLIPLGGVVLLAFLGVIGEWGLYALILLCPLLHFIFMRRMASREMNDSSENFRKAGGIDLRADDLADSDREAEERP